MGVHFIESIYSIQDSIILYNFGSLLNYHKHSIITPTKRGGKVAQGRVGQSTQALDLRNIELILVITTSEIQLT